MSLNSSRLQEYCCCKAAHQPLEFPTGVVFEKHVISEVAVWALQNRTADFVSPEEKLLKSVRNEDVTYPKITALLCCFIFRKCVRSSSCRWTRSWRLYFCLGQPRTCSGESGICSGWGFFLHSLACGLCTCSALYCFSGEWIKVQISKLITRRTLSPSVVVPAQEGSWAAGELGVMVACKTETQLLG